MQMFGECDESMQDHVISRHSLHSVTFYQKQWCQHRRDLFSPFCPPPRSNTLSVLSDHANALDNSSITSLSSNEETPPHARPRGGSETRAMSLSPAAPPFLPPKQRRVRP